MTGKFDGIVLDGRETINEAVDIGNLNVTGQILFTRNVDANVVEITGQAQFGSWLTCDKLTITGECRAKSDVMTQHIKIRGGTIWFYDKVYTESILSSGEITAYDVIRSGRINLNKDAMLDTTAKIKSDVLKVFGKIRSTSSVKSTEVHIVSGKPSEIRNIVTDILVVRRPENEELQFEGKKKYTLTSDFIDCIEADLSACYIGQLYCDSAIIRSGCVIDELLYNKEVEIEPGAVVERLVKA